MESERWYRIHFLSAQLALSIYVSFAIVWDMMIHVSGNAVAGKLGATITATLSALLQYVFLSCKYKFCCKLFKLHLLRNDYSFWLVKYLNYRDRTKSLTSFKFKIYLFQLLSIFSSIFVFAVGHLISWATNGVGSGSGDYFFNRWFALAGALILPLVRLFTSFVYIPDKSYNFFFRT